MTSPIEATPVTALGGNAVVREVTIAAGGSLSGVVDLGNDRLSQVVVPSGWTTADITLQASVDGTTFYDLHDQYGNEVTIAAASSRAIVVSLQDFLSIQYIKVRSGASASPKVQSSEMVLKLVSVK